MNGGFPIVLEDHRYAMMMQQNTGHFKFAGPKPGYYDFSQVTFPGDSPAAPVTPQLEEWTAEDEAQWNAVFSRIIENHQHHENGYT